MEKSPKEARIGVRTEFEDLHCAFFSTGHSLARVWDLFTFSLMRVARIGELDIGNYWYHFSDEHARGHSVFQKRGRWPVKMSRRCHPTVVDSSTLSHSQCWIRATATVDLEADRSDLECWQQLGSEVRSDHHTLDEVVGSSFGSSFSGQIISRTVREVHANETVHNTVVGLLRISGESSSKRF